MTLKKSPQEINDVLINALDSYGVAESMFVKQLKIISSLNETLNIVTRNHLQEYDFNQMDMYEKQVVYEGIAGKLCDSYALDDPLFLLCFKALQKTYAHVKDTYVRSGVSGYN